MLGIVEIHVGQEELCDCSNLPLSLAFLAVKNAPKETLTSITYVAFYHSKTLVTRLGRSRV